jgi:hypothetical protein
MYVLHCTTIETRPPEVKLREWNNIMKEANAAQGELWHDEMLPDHFTPDAKNRYHHQPRDPRYIKRKIRMSEHGIVKEHGLVDNVFYGHMRKMLREGAIVRPYPTRVTIRMIGPRYVTMRPYKSNQPNKAAELTTVTPDEEQRLADKVGHVVHMRLSEIHEPKKTT